MTIKNKIGSIVCQFYGCRKIGQYAIDIVVKKYLTKCSKCGSKKGEIKRRYTVHVCAEHTFMFYDNDVHARNMAIIRNA